MKYHILYDLANKKALSISRQLKKILKHHELNESNFEYLFIIGGDGNFLKFAKLYLNQPIKIVFINAGTLGFYSYVRDLKDFKLKEILDDKNYINLDLIKVVNQDTCWLAINDFSIYSNYAINLDIYINKILLESIKSNGVLVATPMGSTARNKSLHGPIVLPDNKVFIMTEIEPIHNHYYSSLSSSIVLSNTNNIKINFKSYKKYHLIIDGVVYEKDDASDQIEITHDVSKAKFLIKTNAKDWSNKLNFAFKNN